VSVSELDYIGSSDCSREDICEEAIIDSINSTSDGTSTKFWDGFCDLSKVGWFEGVSLGGFEGLCKNLMEGISVDPCDGVRSGKRVGKRDNICENGTVAILDKYCTGACDGRSD